MADLHMLKACAHKYCSYLKINMILYFGQVTASLSGDNTDLPTIALIDNIDCYETNRQYLVTAGRTYTFTVYNNKNGNRKIVEDELKSVIIGIYHPYKE